MKNIVIYNEGELEINVSVENETIWLSQKQIAELFEVTIPNINMHIKAIYKDEELSENRTIQKSLIVRKEGNREVKRELEHYNLDMIISIGYRVNSKKATKFRQWATSILKNYIQNAYVINEHKINELRLSSLENDVSTIKSHIKSNSLQLKQGVFFNNEIFDAYVFISDLIKSATKSIILIDNYIDESILTFFSKNQNIKIQIYTATISKQLQLDINKYNQQYSNLEVKITKNFHDRFMILDSKDVYHIGASLKDLGNKIFAFSKINIDSNDILKRL